MNRPIAAPGAPRRKPPRPRGRPEIARMNAEFVKALGAADVREKLDAVGFETLAGSPEQFATMVRSDLDAYGRIIQSIGLQPE